MLSLKRVVLPLVGSSFLPGKAKETIEEIEDQELAQIAWAEYYFFSAKAKECVEIVEKYLNHEDVILRLSADMLYTFSNLMCQRRRLSMFRKNNERKYPYRRKSFLCICLLCY